MKGSNDASIDRLLRGVLNRRKQKWNELGDALCIVKSSMMGPYRRQSTKFEHLFHAGFLEVPGFLSDGFEIQMFSENGVFSQPLKFSLKERAVEIPPRCPCPERMIQPRLEIVQHLGKESGTVNITLLNARQLRAKRRVLVGFAVERRSETC